MTERIATARLREEGDEQIVVLPDDFRLPGTEVRVRRDGHNVVLEPVARRPEEIQALLDELKRLAAIDEPFMPNGREQPPMPLDDDLKMFGDDLP